MSAEFRVHAIPVGTLPVPSWAALFGTRQPGLLDLGFYIWVVTDGSTLGLVDLGLPLDPEDAAALDRANQGIDDESYFHSPRLLPDALAAAGVDGSDVDFVAITQTVTYHTGGLDAQLLPRAEFYLAYDGIRELLVDRPGHPATEFYFTSSSWAALRHLMIQDRIHLVDRATEIVPGVIFEPTGGHHPGSAALRVRTQAGWTGLLETAFLQENLDQVRPIGIAEDIATCRAVIRRYLAECDEVVAIHDPSNATRFPVDELRAPSSRRTNA